ncbi:hypothetical protein VTL71DRAFT_13261 [Oculimacula yallundae]|uniref:NB-ARC domain-containing protein n=1 Tax=Oculimacula yallundae TaxID=86028 RepID=A0ABR4CJV2_9HELO
MAARPCMSNTGWMPRQTHMHGNSTRTVPTMDIPWNTHFKAGGANQRIKSFASRVYTKLHPRRVNKDPKASVIAVPGYYTPLVPKWGIDHEIVEAARNIDSISHLHIYIYEPTYESSDFTWENFLKTGSDLAEELAHRPIIFVAHSLGGVLLKKVYYLRHYVDARFKLVVECLSGILFMGTPHASVSDEDTLLRLNQVVFSCAKFAIQKQSSRLPRHDVFQLAKLAAAFEQIALVLILSVFEFGGSRSGVPKFFGGRKTKILVDQQLATISSDAERLLGVHLTHHELCKVALLKNNTYSARDFLHSVLQELAVNKRTMVGNTLLPLPQPQRIGLDPLNSLNLGPIEPLNTNDAAISYPGSQGQHKLSRQPLLKPPLQLYLISNSSRENLLEIRKSKLPCFMLSQYPNPDFIGRDDIIVAMDKKLLPRKSPVVGNVQSTRLFALCGMGGIGKTDLAVEYAHMRRSTFGAVFWLEAGGVSQLASDFGRIAVQLGLQTPDEADNLESNIEIAKSWLSRPRNASEENDNWLLIFDNADNLDIITDYVPYQGNGSVLITSRDPFAKEHFFSNGSGIDLEALSPFESATLLRKLITRNEEAQSTDEQDASVELANRLDGLPLAMTQMAGFIRKRHISIREFVELYATDARYAEIHGVGSPVQEHRYGYTLATAYNFRDLSTHSLILLRQLAFMNPDRVQEYIFFDAKRPVGEGSFWTASNFEDARYELITRSIIKLNIVKKELWIHRLIQAEARICAQKSNTYQPFRDAVSLLAQVWPPGDFSSQRIERWAKCEELLPHLERLYQLYVEYARDWSSFKIDPGFPSLMNEAAVYLHERGFPHEGKLYLRLALSLCKQSAITIEPLISDMHLTMGALSNETNDAQTCLEHNILCLTIRKAEAAKDNVPTLRLAFAHSQMGIAYMMVRKFALATEYFKQSVEMLKMIQVDPDEFGLPMCNLGLAYWVQGELDDADRTLTDLRNQRTRLHGALDKVSYKTGRVLQGLGNVRASKAMRLEAEGDYDKAEKFWNESFEIHKDSLVQYESTLGKFNHRTADACHKLAEHYIRMKKDSLAQEFLDRALSIWGDRQWFQNESARSSFLRGTHLKSMGGAANIELGNRWIDRATLLRRQILPDEKPRELETVDFDDLVCFWSI